MKNTTRNSIMGMAAAAAAGMVLAGGGETAVYADEMAAQADANAAGWLLGTFAAAWIVEETARRRREEV